jgi:hypothetical protein
MVQRRIKFGKNVGIIVFSVWSDIDFAMQVAKFDYRSTIVGKGRQERKEERYQQQ